MKINRLLKVYNDNHLKSIKTITDEEYYKLISIGFRSVAAYINEVLNEKFFDNYNIKDNQIISYFKSTSHIELLAIEDYLIKNGMQVQVDGKLHEMFYINGFKMKESYGLFKNELISSYLSNPSKGIVKK